MSLYPLLLAFIQELAPTWRKTGHVNLALLAHAIVLRRSLRLTDLARTYPVPPQCKVAKPKHGLLHRVKRLWRFLAHPTLDVGAVQERLVRLSATACDVPGLWLPILVDLTYATPFAILAASIPQRGRALPLVWRAFRRDLAGEAVLSQNHLIEDALQRLCPTIAPGIRPVVVADREFARAAFFRFLKRQRVHFVIRVDAETCVQHPTYTGAMGALGLRPGGPSRWLPQATYGKEEQEPFNLLAMWRAGHKEPWLLATDLDDPRLVERFYRKRMKIEHGFRDWKHHLRLEATVQVKKAAHLERLLLGVVVAYWYLCLLGTRLNRPAYQALVACTRRLSHFTLALELVAMGHAAVTRVAHRLNHAVRLTLFARQPPTPAYRLRYRRYRASSLLRQTG
jgi:DDE family transposase